MQQYGQLCALRSAHITPLLCKYRYIGYQFASSCCLSIKPYLTWGWDICGSTSSQLHLLVPWDLAERAHCRSSTEECQLMAPKRRPFSDKAHPLKYHLPWGEIGPYFVGLPEDPENMAFVNWFRSPVMLVKSLLRGRIFRYNNMIMF